MFKVTGIGALVDDFGSGAGGADLLLLYYYQA